MRVYKTNLRCQACVASLQAALDARLGPGRWRVDLTSPDKLLYADAEPDLVQAILAPAGYSLGGEVTPGAEMPLASAAVAERPVSYYPLLLVVLFLVGGTILLQLRLPEWQAMQAMSDFMGLFFVVFAFFKLVDVPAFAQVYASYDWIARRWYAWGFVYPFVELTLGVLYLVQLVPLLVHAFTLVLMSVGTLGVAQALLARRSIRCACLGSVFNLPMSSVSLAEDLGMAAMAAGMLVWEGWNYLRT